jgi:hypothetical protein
MVVGLAPVRFGQRTCDLRGLRTGARTRIEYDHKHSGEQIRFYVFEDAATLMADFWTEVETILQKRSRP